MRNRLILLCATNAGGAKNIVPLIKPIREKKLKYLAIGSGITAPIFRGQNIRVENKRITNLKSAMNYLKEKKPAAIICGTAPQGSAERILTAAAKTIPVKSLAVLDEWFNYRARFEDKKGDLIYLPQIICCQDKLAEKEAREEGIPKDILRVTGSPSLANLAYKARQFRLKPPKAPDFIREENDTVIITFLSETHAADYGNSRGKKGKLGEYLGYTEESVKEEITGILKKIGRRFTLVEKLHPSSKKSAVLEKKTGNINLITVKETDLWPLLWHSDLVIGMRSMALLESAMLNRPTVSFQPGLIGRQQCSAVRQGFIKCFFLPAELEKYCSKQLYNSALKKGERGFKNYPFAWNKAALNILKLAMEEKKEYHDNQSSSSHRKLFAAGCARPTACLSKSEKRDE